MSGHLETLAAVVLMGLVGVGFVLVVYLLVRAVAPSNPYPNKETNYECGSLPIGEPWVPFRIQYYVFALLFLIFDIETVFLYPWALIYKKLLWFGFIEMGVFILILLVGLLYAWRRGVLEWV
ncbi:MAG: NADH-quinone oxidoreductase subunit A [Candidatus Aquicultorales bacterium]